MRSSTGSTPRPSARSVIAQTPGVQSPPGVRGGAATPVILATDLAAGYPGHQVWSGANFSIAQDEFVAVLGPNGAGKSTLLQDAARPAAAAFGHARCPGSDPSSREPRYRVCPPGSDPRRRRRRSRHRPGRLRHRRAPLGVQVVDSCRGRTRSDGGQGDRLRGRIELCVASCHRDVRRRTPAIAARPGACRAGRGCCSSTSPWPISTCATRPRWSR